jgi:hypothetical protein
MSEIMKKVRSKIGSKIKKKIQKSTDNLATKEARMRGKVKTVSGPKSSGKVMTAGMKLKPGSNMKPTKKQTFKSAFADARKAGKKTFTFKGEKYNTMTKEDVAKKNKTTMARKKSMGKMKVGLRAASGGYMKEMAKGGKTSSRLKIPSYKPKSGYKNTGKAKKMAYGGKVKK